MAREYWLEVADDERLEYSYQKFSLTVLNRTLEAL